MSCATPVLVHLFPDECHALLPRRPRQRLAQLEFIGGSYDFNRLWITSGVSGLGVRKARRPDDAAGRYI